MTDPDHPGHAYSSDSADQPDALGTTTADLNVPVGKQTIRVSSSVAALLKSFPDTAVPALEGTRVWIGRSKGDLVVHLGDVEQAVLEG